MYGDCTEYGAGQKSRKNGILASFLLRISLDSYLTSFVLRSHQSPLPLKIKKVKRVVADTEGVDERTKRRRRRTGKKAGKENNKDGGKMSVDKT